MDMPKYSASSIGPAAQAWMGQTSRARVLGVFDHACNLVNERREVVSIVSAAIGNGPFNVVVDNRIAFPDGLGSDAEVIVQPDQLSLHGLIIQLSGTTPWQARPDWAALRAGQADIMEQLGDLQDWMLTRAPVESLMAHPALELFGMVAANVEATHEMDLGAQLILNKRFATAELSAAVLRADVEACVHAAQTLAGRGQGLTPAGDDFILGAMYAAWILNPPRAAGVISAAMAVAAVPLTTSLSAAWLQAGARGEASARWHVLFEALLSGERSAVQAAIESVVATGHTSGADGLAGFRDALGIGVESESRPWPSLTH